MDNSSGVMVEPSAGNMRYKVNFYVSGGIELSFEYSSIVLARRTYMRIRRGEVMPCYRLPGDKTTLQVKLFENNRLVKNEYLSARGIKNLL